MRRALLWLTTPLRRVSKTRCPLCRERRRYMTAHLNIDHFGEAS